jgi:hypothetical protein
MHSLLAEQNHVRERHAATNNAKFLPSDEALALAVVEREPPAGKPSERCQSSHEDPKQAM